MIETANRFRRSHPCPICDGYDEAPRGQGVRCYGFISSDGEYAHCTREDHAGHLELNAGSEAYAHKLHGACRCGVEHNPEPISAPPPSASDRKGWGTPVRRHLYKDEDGRAHMLVVKYEQPNGGKTFRPFHPAKPNPDLHNLQHWKVGDPERIILYNLPALLAADPSEPVFLPEGEKDVDTLAGLGLTAVTNPHGAREWRRVDVTPLRGRHIVILADNDKDGRRAAQSRESALRDVAASIRVHVFSDLPEGGDVSDAVQRGMTKEELLQLAAQRATRLHVLPSMEDVECRQVEWIWRPRVPKGKLVFLEGDPGLGKSVLTCVIAAALSNGWTFPGQERTEKREPQRVLMLADEDGYGDTVRPRLEAVGARLRNIQPVLGLIKEQEENPFMLDPEGVAALADHVADYRPALIIIDPLFAYLGGKIDINRANEVRAALRPLVKMCEDLGTTILALRHFTKMNGVSAIYRGQGNIDFTAAARSVLAVREDPDTPGRAVLVHTKSNLAEKGTPLAFRIGTGPQGVEFFWDGEVDATTAELFAAAEDDPGALADAKTFLRDALSKGSMPGKEVQKEARDAGISERTLWRAKGRLGVKALKEGSQWVWIMPEPSDSDTHVGRVGRVGRHGDFPHEDAKNNSANDRDAFGRVGRDEIKSANSANDEEALGRDEFGLQTPQNGKSANSANSANVYWWNDEKEPF